MQQRYEPPWSMYEKQMKTIRPDSDALWEPSPRSDYTRINIGDVGFIRRGKFHLMFSAASSLEQVRLGVDVPVTFKRLDVGAPVPGVPPRPPDCLRTPTVQPYQTAFADTTSTVLPRGHDANSSFQLDGYRGAALVTRFPTYQEDSPLKDEFKTYTKHHYESWVAFARDKRYGNDIQPVLVSGVDMTKDFAMVVYSNEGTSLLSKPNKTFPMFASASASFRGTWRARCIPRINYGPKPCSPSLSEQIVYSLPSQLWDTGGITDKFNQCVFIRYHKMDWRERWEAFFRKLIMRAGAGPHDLGSGDNKGDAHPELTVQLDAEATTNGDEDLGGQCGPIGEGTGPEPDVVQNAPYEEEHDSWDAIADYVFRNSKATSVLMHHGDLAEIHAIEGLDDISSTLAREGPHIAVDEDGVATIIWRENRQLAQQDDPMVPPDPLRLHDLGRALPQFHEQQTASGPLSRRSTPSPEGAESAQEEPQGVAAGTSMELQPSPPALQQLHRLDRSSPDFDNQFSIALSGKEYIQCAPTLQGDDLVWLVNYLDEALGALDLSSPASRKCLRELRSICGTRGILPTSYTISPHLLSISPNLFACGSFGDVYQGTLNGSRVCIKRVRVHTEDTSEGAFKIFRREAVMWKRLEHPNILPLLGVTTSPFQLVSDWMSGGDLPEYIKKNSNADRIGLLCDVAKGLHYLHSRDVIHGDIKGANILVDDSGHACIADFDEATVVKDEDSVEDDSDILDHNPRWAAPEVLEKGTCSKKSDIFSFGMVMIEVFTGAVPFGDMPSLVAMSVITKGKRPPRPAHPAFTDNLWTLMQRCWDHDPSLRPQASGVLEILLVEGSTWGRLISHTLVTHERISLIETVFSDRNQVEMFEHLSGDNAQTLIDMLDEVLDNLGPEIRRNCLGYLARICDHRALLPKSLHIPLRYDLLRPPSYTGGFAEVWKGEYNGREVAIKTLRVYPRDDVEHFRRRFCRVAVTWRSLRHPNVSPLLGVTMTGNQFITVSDWMENGSIHEFLKKNTNANRLELLRDVTRGLVYMHDRGVIHGGLNGYNILTNDSGHACLSGFNLVSMVPDQSTETLSTIEGGAIPWSSPELLDPESFGLKEKRPTRESDCYALGMVIYEVLSGQVPFNACTPFSIFVKVLDDERPARPQGEGGKLFTDGIWKVVELCWKRQPGDRASAKHVLRYLEGIPSLPRPSSNVDADAETGPGDQPDSTLSGS